MPPDAQLIMAAFRPNRAMDDPELFAGRREQLEQLCQAMHSPGSCPIVLGDAGLGKTSLALQVQRIAMGDLSLLGTDRLEDWAFDEPDRYLTLFVQCTDAVDHLGALLQRLINALLEITPTPSDSSTHLVSRVTQHKLSLKVFDSSFQNSYAPEEFDRQFEHLDLEERVVRLAGYVTEKTGQPILFVIDELDRMHNTSGLASFLKAASGETMKFLVVGIAQSLSNLIADHGSIERIAWPVRVPHMRPSELEQILEQARERLYTERVYLSVTTTGARRLARIASGFPWFVHILGQEAFLSAWRDGSKIVGDLHVAAAVRELATNRFAQTMADRCQQAVRDSVNRERLLRTMARWAVTDVPTGDTYRIVEGMGVTNPSVYKGHLAQATYGRVIEAPPFQERGVVRFTNEMFKIYCRLRHRYSQASMTRSRPLGTHTTGRDWPGAGHGAPVRPPPP